MKGDFSRDTFDASRHFLRVLMQQGRVQLDADWNEQTAILLYYLQNLAKDLIGPYGGPARNLGFGLSAREAAQGDFRLEKGNYYVEGILCENDHANGILFSEQPDYPLPEDFHWTDGTYLVYLDVWERHVTWIEEPNIHEIALGSVDTATRAKLMCQVKVTKESSSQSKEITKDNVRDSFQEWIDRNDWQPPNRGRLSAKAKDPSKKDVDPCTIPPEARFRGPENQLYRVEIHKSGPGDGTATFKWSRDNGAIVFPLIELAGNTAIIEHLGRDDRHTLNKEQWVEIMDDDLAKRGEAGLLLQIESIDVIDGKVTLRVPEGTTMPFYDKNSTRHPLLRRWERGAAAIKEASLFSSWLELEDGIMIQFAGFRPLPGASSLFHDYRVGDYWQVPARVANGDVLWPLEYDKQGRVLKDSGSPIPQALPPHGVTHHYAPLWIINVAGGNIAIAAGDCRCKFPSAAICPP